MYPQRNDDVAVPAVAKSLAQLVVYPDQPTLADDRLGAGHGVIQHGVEGPNRHPPSVEAGKPAMPARLRFQAHAQPPQSGRAGDEGVAGLLADFHQRRLARLRDIAEKSLPQLGPGASAQRGADRVVDDATGPRVAGAEQEAIAEAFGAFADGRVNRVLFVAFRPGGNETQRDRAVPVLVDAGQECADVGAAIELGEIMRERAVLQGGLVARHEDPVGAREQGAALRC